MGCSPKGSRRTGRARSRCERESYRSVEKSLLTMFVQYRGCAGAPLTSAQYYSAGYTGKSFLPSTIYHADSIYQATTTPLWNTFTPAIQNRRSSGLASRSVPVS